MPVAERRQGSGSWLPLPSAVASYNWPDNRPGSWDLRVWAASVDGPGRSRRGRREGLSTAEKQELVRLRRENRVLTMENEILKRAAAYFARENVLPE